MVDEGMITCFANSCKLATGENRYAADDTDVVPVTVAADAAPVVVTAPEPAFKDVTVAAPDPSVPVVRMFAEPPASVAPVMVRVETVVAPE
jgi:hypothetical protein